VLRAFRPLVAGTAALVAVSACTPTTVVTSPDPAAVPSGEPTAHGPEATGPITVVGSGAAGEQGSEQGWRYVIYESADGLCTQLELAEVITTGCGDPLPAEGAAMGAVTVDQALESGITPVHGIASDEIFTVWIIDEQTGLRFPATLMPLDDAGLEGQAFLGMLPAELTPTHVQALARNGDVLQTVELP
jgi:hypothetical protein